MAKLTLADLRKMRETQQKQMKKREATNRDEQVIVGMGTCGIAAGAKDVFAAILEELDARGISNVLVSQTGCMGLCHSEPTVEVIVPGMPVVIYGKVDRNVAKQIVTDHLIGHKLIDNHICDKPALDIVANK